jgi:GYD domain
MTHYIVLMTLPESGAPTKDHASEQKAIAEAFAKAGGTLQSMIWTLGRYDVVAHVEVDTAALNRERAAAHEGELSSHEVAAGFAYWLKKKLGVRTETLIGLDQASMNNAGWVSERCGG